MLGKQHLIFYVAFLFVATIKGLSYETDELESEFESINQVQIMTNKWDAHKARQPTHGSLNFHEEEFQKRRNEFKTHQTWRSKDKFRIKGRVESENVHNTRSKRYEDGSKGCQIVNCKTFSYSNNTACAERILDSCNATWQNKGGTLLDSKVSAGIGQQGKLHSMTETDNYELFLQNCTNYLYCIDCSNLKELKLMPCLNVDEWYNPGGESERFHFKNLLLNLDNTSITTEALSNFSLTMVSLVSFVELSLSYSAITMINADTFPWLETQTLNLVGLNLTGGIQSFSAGVHNTINLSYCNISGGLNNDTFKQSRLFGTLDMSYSHITWIGSSAFQDSNFRSMLFKGSTIDSIGDLAFSEISTLGDIDMSYSTIGNFGPSSFQDVLVGGDLHAESLKVLQDVGNNTFLNVGAKGQISFSNSIFHGHIGSAAFQYMGSTKVDFSGIEVLGTIGFQGMANIGAMEVLLDNAKFAKLEEQVFFSLAGKKISVTGAHFTQGLSKKAFLYSLSFGDFLLSNLTVSGTVESMAFSCSVGGSFVFSGSKFDGAISNKSFGYAIVRQDFLCDSCLFYKTVSVDAFNNITVYGNFRMARQSLANGMPLRGADIGGNVDFSHSSFGTLKADSMKYAIVFGNLSLNNCTIGSLEPFAFENMDINGWLDMSNSRIKEPALAPRLFSGLRAKSINLENCGVTDLLVLNHSDRQIGPFVGLGLTGTHNVLPKLILSHNNIQKIRRGSFEGVGSWVVDLFYNNITIYEPFWFKSMMPALSLNTTKNPSECHIARSPTLAHQIKMTEAVLPIRCECGGTSLGTGDFCSEDPCIASFHVLNSISHHGKYVCVNDRNCMNVKSGDKIRAVCDKGFHILDSDQEFLECLGGAFNTTSGVTCIQDKDDLDWKIALFVLGGLVILVLFIALVCLCKSNRKKRKELAKAKKKLKQINLEKERLKSEVHRDVLTSDQLLSLDPQTRQRYDREHLEYQMKMNELKGSMCAVAIEFETQFDTVVKINEAALKAFCEYEEEVADKMQLADIRQPKYHTDSYLNSIRKHLKKQDLYSRAFWRLLPMTLIVLSLWGNQKNSLAFLIKPNIITMETSIEFWIMNAAHLYSKIF
eukprot:m.63887 g.63887  ORF g.63887 m.63887 type:complete len:1103 (+) comp11609_c0_seq3:122-3430(+)